MRKYLTCALLCSLSCAPLLASTYQFVTTPGQGPDFFWGQYYEDTKPFESQMVFQWQAAPGNFFALDSQDLTLTLGANLGLYSEYLFSGTGILFRDIAVTLGGVGGQISVPTPTISATIPLNSTATVPGPNPPNVTVDGYNGTYGFFPTFGTISGTGTFTSISFTLTFDGAGPGQLGVPFLPLEWLTGTPYLPNFYVSGDGGGFLALVPEPSTWVMGLAGVACAGWGMSRRRQRFADCSLTERSHS